MIISLTLTLMILKSYLNASVELGVVALDLWEFPTKRCKSISKATNYHLKNLRRSKNPLN